MTEVKWIKILTNIFDDEKIRFIETMPNGEQILVIWFKILCLAGKSNSNGFLMMTDKIAYTDDMLASLFNRDIKIICNALVTFEKLEMIEIFENKIFLKNWERHQNTEKLQIIREQTRKRVEKYRNNQLCNAKSVTRPLQVTQCNATDIDIDIEEDIKKEIYKEKKKESYNLLIDTYTQNNDLKEAILEFIKMRKLIKKPLTDKALKLTINKLDKLTQTDTEKIHILEQSIESCWQGLYPIKDQKCSVLDPLKQARENRIRRQNDNL